MSPCTRVSANKPHLIGDALDQGLNPHIVHLSGPQDRNLVDDMDGFRHHQLGDALVLGIVQQIVTIRVRLVAHQDELLTFARAWDADDGMHMAGPNGIGVTLHGA